MHNMLIADAVSAAGIAILVLDEAGLILDSTPPASRMLGYETDELIGMPISSVLPLAPADVVGNGSARRICHGSMAMVTARDRADRAFAMVLNVVQWTDHAGRVRSTVVIRDATAEDEKQISVRDMPDDLIQSDNAIRGANIGVFEFDPATESVKVSPIWRQMLEIGPNEHLDVQKEWRSRVHPSDLAAALAPIKICLEGQTERASCEYRLNSRDLTRWRWMRADIAVAERDQTGKVIRLVGAQTDITDRKTMEEELRISIEQFRSAFENAPIGKAIVGLDGAWLKVNPALCALLGYSEAELLRTNFQHLTHPDDLDADLRQLDRLAHGDISSYTMEKRYRCADGAIMWGALNVGMVRTADGKPDHFIAQIVDLTEQRRLDQMKNEFVSVVSHELRTPLTSILGALTLLETYDDAPFPDAVQRLLFIAKTNGDRLHNLINDILDFQKFTAREMLFSVGPQPVARLLDETLIANLVWADKYGVRITSTLKDRSLIALVDPKRFHQVMANLLSNATKFADPGSTVEVSAKQQGPSIRVSVVNVGPGIPEDFQDQVFKPFSQATSVSALRSGGTGLGLSITKQIVQQMGGEIGFETVPGARTTFWFTIRSKDLAQ